MPISAAKKAYRQQPAEREKRRQFSAEYRQRPEVKAREAERAKRRRATKQGAATNRSRVKADRAKLGRAYVSQLLAASVGARCAEIPTEFIDIKREQILLRRLATSLEIAATHERESK